MDAIEPNVLALVWLGPLFAVDCVAFFIVAGMFPLGSRPGSAKAPGGLSLIAGNSTALVVLTAAIILHGWTELRWTTLVIGGGVIFLFTPSLLQSLPERWRDGRAGLAVLLLVQMAAIFTLLSRATTTL